jgi:2'-5' RNA ligase
MRLFYCCELPEAVQRELERIAQPLRALPRVAWVRPENFHITLKFLGEVAPKDVDALKILGESVATGSQRFELTFDTVGAFPTVHRPRVLWIGASSVPAELLFLHERLERELTKMGYPHERFTLHVTVGRVKDEKAAGQLPQLISGIGSFACRALITHLTLMESQLSPSGAIYTPVATWEFSR